MLIRKIFKYKKISIVFIILIICILWLSSILKQTTFYEGIYVEGVNISGLNKEQAKKILQNELDTKYKNSNMILSYKDKKWEVPLKDISYTIFIDQALIKAYTIGRNENIFYNIFTILKIKFSNENIIVDYKIENQKLTGILKSIKIKLDKKEENAKVLYDNNTISHIREEEGISLNINKNFTEITKCISEKRFCEFKLIVDKCVPKIKYNQIQYITKVISSFSTEFDKNNINRTHNINTAVLKTTNILLMPKETFSMNSNLGPRTLENDYKEASVIVGNEIVSGIGGGICQVTTTLYVSAVLAKFNIIERTHHSMPVAYVQKGFDATVSEGYIDLKLQNNKENPVYIISEVSGNKVTVNILGNIKDVVKTQLQSEIIEEYMPSMPEFIKDNTISIGEKFVSRKPQNGYKCIVYRNTYNENNIIILKEKISEDTYDSVTEQIKTNELTGILW